MRKDEMSKIDAGGEDRESSLGDILDHLGAAETGDTVSVDDVLGAFEDRSSGVLVTMLGLLAALPIIGSVPGMSIATGALILLALAHSALGGGRLTLPGRIGRLRIGRKAFDKGLEKGRAITDRIDRVLRPRLLVLTETMVARMAIKIAIAFLALTMFPLAFVPYGVTPAAVGIVAFGLALIARDGAMAVVGYVMSAVTVLTFLALT